ncbi:MAG: hypothetical protein HOW73_20370 [Polyangiaceae bacterium]|nr:hypothetical protein [Polyangiaceae bacterium]
MKTPRHYRRWSPADDKKLRLLWGAPIANVAVELGRTQRTVYWRARKLGLECGAPQGWEYLTAAAERTGYDTGQLRRILRAAGARPQRSISRPDVVAKRRFNAVDPLDVDDAVAKWCRQETVEEAAARSAISGDTLRRLLLAAGHVPPRSKRKRWRLDASVIDAVVAAYRARVSQLSVRQHAKRVGLDRTTLAKRLRAAGVLGEKQPGTKGLVRLPAEVVDRAIGRAA